jgi:hypothetical protein
LSRSVWFEVEEELFAAIIIIITLDLELPPRFLRPWLLPLIPHNCDRWKVSLPKHRIVYKWMRRRRVIIILGCWKQGIKFSGLWRNQTG